jgi:4,5-dihydroxyphthalate decarboxylase
MSRLIPRDGSVITRFAGEGSDEYEVNCRALVDGEIDVLMTTENAKYDMLTGEARARPLFPDAREAETTYFRRTGIIPIMHLLVMRRSVVEQYPALPQELFELFCRAKKESREWQRSVPSLSMAWKNQYLEEERKFFAGRDPWVYGLKANFTALSKFLSYCHLQGISARQVTPYDLFVPSTWELSE